MTLDWAQVVFHQSPDKTAGNYVRKYSAAPARDFKTWKHLLGAIAGKITRVNSAVCLINSERNERMEYSEIRSKSLTSKNLGMIKLRNVYLISVNNL